MITEMRKMFWGFARLAAVFARNMCMTDPSAFSIKIGRPSGEMIIEGPMMVGDGFNSRSDKPLFQMKSLPLQRATADFLSDRLEEQTRKLAEFTENEVIRVLKEAKLVELPSLKEAGDWLIEHKFYGPFVIFSPFPVRTVQPLGKNDEYVEEEIVDKRLDATYVVQMTEDVVRLIQTEIDLDKIDEKMVFHCVSTLKIREDFHKNIGIVRVKEKSDEK